MGNLLLGKVDSLTTRMTSPCVLLLKQPCKTRAVRWGKESKE